MTDTRRFFEFWRWSISEQEAREARLLRVEDYHMAWLVGGSILLAGVLVMWLGWLAQRDAVGWEQTKQGRTGRMETRVVLNREEWIR